LGARATARVSQGACERDAAAAHAQRFYAWIGGDACIDRAAEDEQIGLARSARACGG
jgi:hypothetical protein